MAKKIDGGGPRVEAAKWREGRLLTGFLTSIDTIPNCDSRKINMALGAGGKEPYAAWETATLARQLEKCHVGGFYRILCLGKVIETKNGLAWGFEVQEAESQGEVDAWTEEFRHAVAGGMFKE